MRLSLVAVALALFPSIMVAQREAKAGLATRVFHPAAHRNWRGAEQQELHVTVWYTAIISAHEVRQLIGPADAPLFEAGSASPNAEMEPALRKLPLVLLSHGTGGSALQMAWLGTALARQGFIAAAVDHPGNNSNAPYTAEGFVLWWERAVDLSNVLDGLLKDEEFGPRIDATRVGAAGFSLGGYTVLELAGAQTDISVLFDHCRAHPDTPTCHVPEMARITPPVTSPDDLLTRVRKSSGESLARSGESYRDPRVRAVFGIAPALAQVLTPDSLHSVRVPVEVVVGEADPIAPPRDNADYIRADVRGARETVLPGGVAHYTFLDTCTPAGKQSGVFCGDAPGVDREAVHAQVAEMAVKFFVRALKLK